MRTRAIRPGLPTPHAVTTPLRPGRPRTPSRRGDADGLRGSVSKVEMRTPIPLICKALLLSISTFETLPSCALFMCHHRSPTTSSCHRLSEYGRGRLTMLVPCSFSSPVFLLTRPSQIPPDLVVKSQAIEIVEVILSRIRRPHVIHTLCRHRKARCELLSTSEAHWFTTKSDGMWKISR